MAAWRWHARRAIQNRRPADDPLEPDSRWATRVRVIDETRRRRPDIKWRTFVLWRRPTRAHRCLSDFGPWAHSQRWGDSYSLGSILMLARASGVRCLTVAWIRSPTAATMHSRAGTRNTPGTPNQPTPRPPAMPPIAAENRIAEK